jgi:2-dehydro-3-deoxyphosphogluconate aldolase/(4S)-4-hydroxy-2-oxoglutarate aldolase
MITGTTNSMASPTNTTSGTNPKIDLADVVPFMRLSPVIPVVTLASAADAVPLAKALLAGGIGVIEVTFRSNAAVAGIEAIRRECSNMRVGAGTIWTPQQAMQASSAGAQFLVSPGIADAVQDVAMSKRLPYLPGAQTASEVAHLLRRGLRAVKFFPAGPAGGPAALSALAAVFPDVLFCATGGVSEANAAEYLQLPYVPCVGGSWLAGAKLVAAQDWDAIRAIAERAAALGARPVAAGPS